MHWKMQNEEKWKSPVYAQAFTQPKFLLLICLLFFFWWNSLKDTRVHSSQWEGCCAPI